jgi:hypothetical protein
VDSRRIRSRVQQFLWKTLWKTSAAGGFSSANPPDLRFAPRWCDTRAAPERHIIAEQKKIFSSRRSVTWTRQQKL